MTVFGDASIRTEKSILKDLYGKSDDAWFEGVDDPNRTAIQVQPTEGQFWNANHGALMSLFKIGIAAVTGNKPILEWKVK